MSKSKMLLVEGVTEKYLIPYLIEANGVKWGNGKDRPVEIESCDGYQNIVKPDVIATTLQQSSPSLTALGIVIDADNNPRDRWQSIRNICQKSIPDLPIYLPENGLICDVTNANNDKVKFGIWMMPDNQTCGMLETFLAYLIPDERETLWEFAQSSVEAAAHQGAKFTEFQIDKANIYTWLAWQNPPGRQLQQAVKETVLNPQHPRAQKFVRWFKELYGL
jgi:hypothetical protein